MICVVFPWKLPAIQINPQLGPGILSCFSVCMPQPYNPFHQHPPSWIIPAIFIWQRRVCICNFSVCLVNSSLLSWPPNSACIIDELSAGCSNIWLMEISSANNAVKKVYEGHNMYSSYFPTAFTYLLWGTLHSVPPIYHCHYWGIILAAAVP